MKYVGGYGDYLLLLEDARALEDVQIAIAGQGDAAAMKALTAKAKGGA